MSEILTLALLGLIPVGVLALLLFAFARRKRNPQAKRGAAPIVARTETAKSQPTRVVSTEPAAPMTEEPLADDERVVAARKPSHATITPVYAARMHERETSGGLPHTGASVALPAKAPESPQQREALLKRMVEAKPDRANPFTARKARRHRAKLILASLDRKFESGPPKMDLSQYPNNWPALAQRDRRAAA